MKSDDAYLDEVFNNELHKQAIADEEELELFAISNRLLSGFIPTVVDMNSTLRKSNLNELYIANIGDSLLKSIRDYTSLIRDLKI